MSACLWINQTAHPWLCPALSKPKCQVHKLQNFWIRKDCWRLCLSNLLLHKGGKRGSEVRPKPQGKIWASTSVLFPLQLTGSDSAHLGTCNPCDTSFSSAGWRLPCRCSRREWSESASLPNCSAVWKLELPPFQLQFSAMNKKKQEDHRTAGTHQERQPVPAVAPCYLFGSFS